MQGEDMPSDKELFAKLRYRRSVQPDGSVEYYNEAGLLHREDGPAIIYASGSKHWCINGQLHREDDPAIESSSGDRYWYRNGKLHREGGPAFITARGTRKWALNGRLHRTDGPAIEWSDGDREWWLNGVKYTKQDYHALITELGYTV